VDAALSFLKRRMVIHIGTLAFERVCKRGGVNFQDGIKKNFDFSYKTANNFINVYQHCLGFRELA
jgi:hypothetical protein